MSQESSSPSRYPRRGEVWHAYLDPVVGREQAGRRPVLVITEDVFNAGPSELVVVLPITSRLREIPSHVVIQGGVSGLDRPCAIMCEAVRSLSRQRLRKPIGRVPTETLAMVTRVMRVLLGL